LSAEIEFDKVPRFDFLETYVQQNSMPGGTTRNWDSYGAKISGVSDFQKAILADPQTSGGLLVAVEESQAAYFESILTKHGNHAKPFGRLHERNANVITVV
jgi:selenide, water dikinase